MTKKKAKKKSAKKTKKKTPGQTTLDPFGGGTIDRKEMPTVVPHPTAGKKITDFENKLDEQLGEAAQTEPEKRGRGRPRKDSMLAPEFVMSEDIIRQTLKIPFDLWAASQKLNALKLLDPEAAALAAPVKQLLDYYLPNMPTVAFAWFSLSITVYTIMLERMTLVARIRKEKAAHSSDSAGVKETGTGSPRPSDSNKPGKTAKIEFPGMAEPVKI